MDEKVVSIEWRLNRLNDEDSEWRFGSLTAAELNVIQNAKYISLDREAWVVSNMDITCSPYGITHAVIHLFEAENRIG